MVASGSKDGMCILDNNYKAAFNFMVMLWVSNVQGSAISRLKNVYVNIMTNVVGNHIL